MFGCWYIPSNPIKSNFPTVFIPLNHRCFPTPAPQAEAVTVKAGDAALEPSAQIGERFKHGDAVSFEARWWRWPWVFFGRCFTGFQVISRDFTMEIWVSFDLSRDFKGVQRFYRIWDLSMDWRSIPWGISMDLAKAKEFGTERYCDLIHVYPFRCSKIVDFSGLAIQSWNVSISATNSECNQQNYGGMTPIAIIDLYIIYICMYIYIYWDTAGSFICLSTTNWISPAKMTISGV